MIVIKQKTADSLSILTQKINQIEEDIKITLKLYNKDL